MHRARGLHGESLGPGLRRDRKNCSSASLKYTGAESWPIRRSQRPEQFTTGAGLVPGESDLQTRRGRLSLEVEVVRPAAISAELTRDWSELQQANPALDSPFFCPEFARIVGRLRPDCRVAVLRDHGQPVGFFPYHQTSRGKAAPVGLGMADFLGVVAKPNQPLSLPAILAACGATSWHYDHWVRPQATACASSAPWEWKASPWIKLSGGYEQYRRERRSAGCKTIAQAERKARKMQREVGPLMFQMNSTDVGDVEQLIAWKIDQYRRIRCVHHLAESWKVELLRQLFQTQTNGFAGVTSVLYAGDKLAAVHLGLRANGVLHYWFPAYSRDLLKYSPGLILLVRLLEASSVEGVRRVDLGKGDERYKRSLQNGETMVAVGSVDLRGAVRHVERGWHLMRERIRKSVFRAPAQSIIRSLRAWRVYR